MQKFRILFQNNLFLSGIYKGISGLSLFISIPLLIQFLGENSFSIWVLIFALFQWILLMDLGISSVLKTKIPVLKLENNPSQLNAYIKSTYKITTGIAFFSFLIFSVFIYFFDITNILNITGFSLGFIRFLFILNIGFFCVQFILNTHKSLYVGFLKGKYAEKSIAVNQIFFLISLVSLYLWGNDFDADTKLLMVSICNGIVGIGVHLGYTMHLFKSEKISFQQRTKSPKNFLKELYRMGIKFMIIQVCFIFIFNSDTYLISYFFGSTEVVSYEILTKYFQFPLMVLMAAMSPLWSIFAKKYYEKEYHWLLEGFRKFNLGFLVISLLFVFFALLAPWIFPLWISPDFNYSQTLFISIGFLTLFRLYSLFYGFFLSGIGELKRYILTLVVSVLLKIPITYFLIQFHFGVSSVAIASAVLVFIWCFLQPWESYRIVKKNLTHKII